MVGHVGVKLGRFMPCAGRLINAVLVFGSELRGEKNICAVLCVFASLPIF